MPAAAARGDDGARTGAPGGGGEAGGPPPSPAPRAEVGLAVGLGWQMAELYRAPVPLGPDRPGSPPARLAGLSDLPSRTRILLGLDQIEVGLAALTAGSGFQWTALAPAPTTGDTRERLDACCAPGAPSETADGFRRALSRLHEALLSGLLASDYQVGKGYGIGRALSDICRPGQSEVDLVNSFGAGGIHEMAGWIVDLTSVLPPHAGRVVTQSMAWWTQEITVAANPAMTNQWWQAASEQTRHQAAPITQPVGGHSGRTVHREVTATRPQPPSLPAFALTVQRQGQLWRSVLTGEKKADDLLTPHDFVAAGQRVMRASIPLTKRVAWSLKWVLLVLLVAAAAVILVAGLADDGSAGTRLLAGLVAAGAAAGAIWRLIRAPVDRVVSSIEGQLWGGELDAAIAEAVTLPPVGRANPSGLVVVAEEPVSAAWPSLSPPVHSASPSPEPVGPPGPPPPGPPPPGPPPRG